MLDWETGRTRNLELGRAWHIGGCRVGDAAACLDNNKDEEGRLGMTKRMV